MSASSFVVQNIDKFYCELNQPPSWIREIIGVDIKSYQNRLADIFSSLELDLQTNGEDRLKQIAPAITLKLNELTRKIQNLSHLSRQHFSPQIGELTSKHIMLPCVVSNQPFNSNTRAVIEFFNKFLDEIVVECSLSVHTSLDPLQAKGWQLMCKERIQPSGKILSSSGLALLGGEAVVNFSIIRKTDPNYSQIETSFPIKLKNGYYQITVSDEGVRCETTFYSNKCIQGIN